MGDLGIKTIYLHMFDIQEKDGGLRPTSTLIFSDTLPGDIEIVPVVFIEPSDADSERLSPPLRGADRL